ncbi:hypothetical protein I5M27_18390, partial [Adhaeribacter sp. BT258]|nr:hypothetical protein [Adhaeribacter terrigena]
MPKIYSISFFSLIILLSSVHHSWAQNAANYSFATSTTGSLALDLNGNAVDMSSGTTQLVAANLDNNASTLQGIPFSFMFMGTAYTQFSASSNGMIRLGSTVIGTGTYTVSTGTATSPIISAFGGDLSTGPSGKVHFKIFGAAPNRTLVIEFLNMSLLYQSSPTNDGTYQVRLYESTGVVEFVYGAMTRNIGTGALNSQQVGIGFSAGSSAGTRAYIISATNTNTNNSATFNQQTYTVGSIPNLDSPTISSQRTYSYTPSIIPNAPSNLTFSNIRPFTITLNWADNATNEIGYTIYRSTDNINFTVITQLASNAQTYTDNAVAPGTQYYYQVRAYAEAHYSGSATGNQTTPVLVPLNGTYTLNQSGSGSRNFTSFTDAITSLNENGISGSVTFNVTAGQTFSENVPAITATGIPGSTITFQKSGSGANPIISSAGTTSSSDAGITIAGGDYFTFDGIDISIASGSALEYGYLIRNASASNGATNNTIQNASITLNRSNTSSIALLQSSGSTGGGFTPTNATGTNQNNTYSNLSIQNVYNGILLNGGSGTLSDNNNTVSGNIIGSIAANDLAGSSSTAYGIKASLQNNVKIFYNEVRNITTTSGTIDGVFVDLALGAAQVYNNKINNLAITSTTTTVVVTGMRLNTYTTNNGHSITAYNNIVTNLNHGFTGTASANRRIIGIVAQGNGSGSGNNLNIHFNSVRLEPAAAYKASSTAFEIGTASGAVMTVTNNIFANFMAAQTGVAKHYAWVTTSATATGNTGSVSNYNDLYIADAGNGFIGLTNTTDRATLADWQTATNQDANSVSVIPQFVSASDLHASAPALNNAGTLIAGITTDMDGETRNATTPDIGADEFTPSSLDLGVTAFVNPGAIGCFSANESIEVTIKNYGTNAVDFSVTPSTVEIVISGAFPQTISHAINTGSLAAGASLNVVAGTANMTAYGTYIFNASTITPGDGNSGNDAMPETTRLLAPPVAQPLRVDFAGFNGTNLTSQFTGWYEAIGAITPTGNASGWANDDFANVTGGANGISAKINLWSNTKNEWIISPKITATATTELHFDLALTLWNNTSAATLGSDDELKVMVSTDCGSTFTAIRTYNASTSINNTGQTEVVNLASFAGQNIIVAFYATEGTIAGASGGPNDVDLFLDNIFIGTPPSLDMGVIAMVSPGPVGCYSANENISVTIRNYGTAPIDFSINPTTVTVNVTGPVPNTISTVINSGTLPTGDTQNITVGQLDLRTTGGTYTFNGSISVTGDGKSANDVMPQVSRTVAPLAVLPQAVDFTGFTGSNLNTGFPDWKEATGAAKPSSTSSVWTSAATTQATFLGSVTAKLNFTTTASTVRQEWIVGPKVAATATTALKLKAAVTSSGGNAVATMLPTDSLKIIVSADCGETYIRVGAITGNDNLTNALTTFTFNLGAYNGQDIIVALLGKTGTPRPAVAYDLHVDDIFLGTPPSTDLGITSILSPGTGCGLSTQETISVTVSNFGSNVQTNIPLQYSLNNGTPIAEIMAGPLAPGASATYNFNTKADFSIAGTYTIAAATTISGDADASNNSAAKAINSIPVITSYPYSQNFENGAGNWTTGGINNSWALGTPAGSVINSAASGSNAWKTNLTGNHNNNEQSFVTGPCFNFSTLVKPMLEMKIWWTAEFGWDGAVLQSSIDGGTTWQNVGTMGDPNNWFNYDDIGGNPGGQLIGWTGTGGSSSNGWVTAKHELNGLGGQASVKLRIAFGSDISTVNNGFAFDDILIQEAPALNIGAIALATPLATGCYAANEPVTITIQNFGIAPIDFTTNPTAVTVNITGATTATLNTTITTGTLAAGATHNVYVDILNMTPAGTYTFNATATVTGDGDTSNDAMPQTTRSVAPIAALPQAVDFNSFTGADLSTHFSGWKEATGAAKPSSTSSAWTSAATTQATFLGSVTAKLNFATSTSTTRNEWIVGPKVPATATTALKLKAAVTSSGGNAVATMLPTDSLKIMVSADCGETYVRVGAITGNDNLSNALTDFIFDLSAYNGQNIIVALMGKTGAARPTTAYDLHIDDLFLGTPPTLDIDAVALALATSKCYAGNEPINVTILNNGPTALDFSVNPVTVTVNVTGVVTRTLSTIVSSGTLAAGATQNVFVDNLNMRIAGGTYTFNGTATVAGDGNTSNDAMPSTSRTAIGLATLPQQVNFTGFTDDNLAALFSGWSEASGTVTPTGTTSAWASDDFGNVAGGVNGVAAKINLWNTGDNIWIISPKVNPTATTELRFDLALTRYGNTNAATLGPDDEFKIMISTDCGSTYTAIRTFNASTPISNTGQTETINLSAYAGQDITVAFFATEGSTGGGIGAVTDLDLFLDNIFIGDCTPGLWSGQVSRDWNVASNWSCNTVPTATTNVSIPAGLSNYPQLAGGTAQANNLTVATGASITINGGALQLAGNLSNSGTFSNAA